MRSFDAVQYIHSFSWRGSVPGLSRIRELVSLLGHPENDLKFIHIAGTNGKGSVAQMLASVLEESGLKVGLFTSPYVRYFNERIRINGKMISSEDLDSVTEQVKEAAEKMSDPPTEFELLTAIGLLYFKRENCDIVVMETGLGGLLDSTNIIRENVLSVISSISLDHTEILGDTIEKIAREKAGIIKKGCPVVIGNLCEEAEKTIKGTAHELSAKVYRADAEIEPVNRNLEGMTFRCNGKEYFTKLAGNYQLDNLKTVFKALDILFRSGYNLSYEIIKNGLKKASWPARFELISKKPVIIYDGAHNPEGIRSARETIETLLADKNINLVFGVMKDKSYQEMIHIISPVISRAFIVRPKMDRALDTETIKSEFRAEGITSVDMFDSVGNGVSGALKSTDPEKDAVVILGSLYMYGEVMDFLDTLHNKGGI